MADDSDIMNDMLENASVLNVILHNCLDQHIAKRIEDQKKHHNFALSWFHDNVPRFFSARATLNRHVIEDVKSVDSNITSLRNSFSKILALLK